MPTISMFYGILVKILICAWATIHKEELLANWYLAKNSESLFLINPLN